MYRFIRVICFIAALLMAGLLWAQEGESPESPRPGPQRGEPAEPESETVKWESSFDAALEKASSEDKMLMMFFYKKGSKLCAELENESINQSEVVELSKKFVCVKVEKNRDKAIAEKFGIGSVPHTLFITGERKKLGRVRGYEKPGVFAKKVKEVYESIKIEKESREVLRNQPDNLEANLKLGKVYIIREMRDLAIHCLKKVVNGDPKNKKKLLVEAAFRLGFVQYENGMFDQARKNFEKVTKYDAVDSKGYDDDMLAAEAHMYMKDDNLKTALKKWRLFVVKYSNSELMPEALFYMGGVYYQMNNNEKAIEYWEKLVKEYPSSGEADRAKYWIPQLKKQLKGR